MSCSTAGQSKPKYLRSEFDPQVEVSKIWSDVTIVTEMTIRKSLNLQVAIMGVYLFIFSTALLHEERVTRPNIWREKWCQGKKRRVAGIF